jgi:excisionase family DNA binding protein
MCGWVRYSDDRGMMSDQHTEHNYLRAIETAALLRCHPRTVSRMIASGQLEATKVARSWRIRRADVEAMLPGGAA